MGNTTRSAAALIPKDQARQTAAGPGNRRRTARTRFDDFASALTRELAPGSLLETLLAERVTLAAWRLLGASNAETDAAARGAALPPVARDTLRAERSLTLTLGLLDAVQAAGRGRWGRATRPLPTAVVAEPEPDTGVADSRDEYSNEWPVLPRGDEGEDLKPGDAEDAEDEAVPVRWQDRLVFDFNVSERSPVVKGTWVTVSHVVSLIVDGWSWADVLRSHPELCEDDVRTCLAYAVEQDDRGER